MKLVRGLNSRKFYAIYRELFIHRGVMTKADGSKAQLIRKSEVH